MKTSAWFMDLNKDGLREGELILPEPKDNEALISPVYTGWEANMSHALSKKPLDLCKFRNENSIVIGNSGVVRVVRDNAKFKAGDLCIFLGNREDADFNHGYPRYAHGYDAANSIGLLTQTTLAYNYQLYKIPHNSRFSVEQWAAFSLRYLAAWGNWKVAKAAYRALISETQEASPHVFGWGGGTTLAILQLAKKQNFQVSMISSQDSRLQLLKSMGINAIDRKEFIDLDIKSERSLYEKNEKVFLSKVKEITQNRGVSIFADFIGEPVYTATLKAMARPGVITSAGWKEGMNLKMNRAMACINWLTFVNTHWINAADTSTAITYAENEAWMPPTESIDSSYVWSDIPKLHELFSSGKTKYFPLIKMNT